MKRIVTIVLMLIGGVLLYGCSSSPSGNNPTTNNAPSADASASKTTIEIGKQITLDASSSTDADGDALSYSWSLTTPGSSSAQLSDDKAMKPTFTPDVAGDYNATVTVSDGNGESDNASVIVTAQQAGCSTIELDSGISSDKTLENHCTGVNEIDYRVTQNIGITAAVTVEPGVVVSFESGAGMTVKSGGTFNAVGTTNEHIVFTGEQQSPGFWYGIEIRTNSPDNVMDYVDVSYGGSDYGNVMVGHYGSDSGRLKITNSTLSQSGNYGLYMKDDSRFTGFSNNTFTSNTEAPLMLPVNAIGELDGASTYADNNGEDDRVKVFSQTVSQAATWSDLEDTEYLFDGMTDVESDITVEAGTQFIFTSGAGIDVKNGGTFEAVGTSNDRIVFTGEQQSPGYWYGLLFRTNTSSNVLDYVDVKYAGSNSGNVMVGYYGSDKGRLDISNSRLSYSGGHGLYMKDDSRFTGFSSNTFSNNIDAALRLPANAIAKLDGSSNYEDSNGINRVVVYGKTVTQDVTWHDLSDDTDGDGIEAAYLFEGTTDVKSELTVEEGATLLFKEDASIWMKDGGTMRAVGTSERIEFAGKAQDRTQGYWYGLVFQTNSPKNVLDNVLVHNGGSDYGNVMVGYYSSDNAQLTIRDSQIGYSGTYGVWVASSSTYSESGNHYSNNMDGNVHNQ